MTNGPCNLEIVIENFDQMLKSQNRHFLCVSSNLNLLLEREKGKKKNVIGSYGVPDEIINFVNSLKSVQLHIKLNIEYVFVLNLGSGLALMLYSL